MDSNNSTLELCVEFREGISDLKLSILENGSYSDDVEFPPNSSCVSYNDTGLPLDDIYSVVVNISTTTGVLYIIEVSIDRGTLRVIINGRVIIELVKKLCLKLLVRFSIAAVSEDDEHSGSAVISCTWWLLTMVTVGSLMVVLFGMDIVTVAQDLLL